MFVKDYLDNVANKIYEQLLIIAPSCNVSIKHVTTAVWRAFLL